MPRAPGQGRKPKPTHLKVLAGNPGKRALKSDEPLYDAADEFDAPEWLTGLAEEKWHELAPKLAGTRVLTAVDLHNLEMFCQAYARWREAEDNIADKGVIVETPFGPKKNPACTIVNECARQIATFGALLGLDPSSRSRLGGGGSKPKNSFSGVIKPKQNTA